MPATLREAPLSRVEHRNLSVAAYAQGVTQFIYQTSHTISEVLRPSYFSDAAIQRGDFILVSASNGGCQMFVTHRGPVAMGQPVREAV